MRLNFKLLTVLIVTVFISCQSSKLKQQAEMISKDFFSNLKTETEDKATLIYKGFANFDNYSKSDSARIVSSTYNNGIVTVLVHNRYTNGIGKLTEKDISLYFKKDSSNNLVLFDTKGLTDFSVNNNYIFGIKTGCISTSIDTTDQAILSALKKAKILMLDKAIDVYIELERDIKVVNFSWENLYSGSASGKAIVRNNSKFSVPKLKYKVTFKDGYGNSITSEDGYVTYGVLEPGENKSFTFYSSYVGGALRATMDLKFDDDLIYEYLAKKAWTGKECDEYFKKHTKNEIVDSSVIKVGDKK